ncbi:hypothetical protein GWI33_010890 [Rhynchophorus ferrugineus]|uniref:E3 ubiquitin-protein ligase RNF10 n=1 Tax=Rhynchophorus ferrugineus TaxID=354439 RepID=A0A834M9Y0_RHYFE|nr:hypothetical protein GWI33_010890 [Rhynchophorus ferrugineus]
MEKKGNRNGSSSSRGSSGADLKKNQDGATGKSWPRGPSRRREPPCGFSKSNEVSRKPQPQRNGKASDKRPKPRGYYYSGTVPRNEEAGLEEFDEPELGSVFSPGSKKQSLNHLLNFSFAPREAYQQERKADKSLAKLLVTRKHKYKKEHFLQANCQFIVNEKGDYKQYMNNPDALVDWDFIEQVNVQVNDEPSCPICLYPPVAAKMTKCGHIYCWSCILHYLALSDKQWRKCPICFDAIKKDDLKSVTITAHKTFNINNIITFKLMKRLRGSLFAYPADDEAHSDGTMFNMADANIKGCYSKLLLADARNILDIIDKEATELEVQMAQDENCPEKCFMEEAVRLLEKRREKVLADGAPIESHEIKVEENISEIAGTVGEECGAVASKYFYFYQAADGQHLYLHAINARMLEHTYGSLEFGPKTITGKILEKEGGSMTEELRNRLRYLQHLPVTCQFEVAEIRLKEPTVNKDTLAHFKEQIDTRTKRRQRRAREEKRREIRIEAEENRKLGKYESPDLHLDNRHQFPDVKEAHFMFPDFISASRPRTESESTFNLPSETSNSAELTPDACSLASLSLESGYTGPSFASMLASEKKSSTQPAQRSTQSSSTAVKLINVTGSKLTTTPSHRVSSRRFDDDNPDPDDYEPVPDFNRSFGDSLAQALATVSIEDSGVNNGPSTTGKKKKKKSKQKVLFSTHIALPGN